MLIIDNLENIEKHKETKYHLQCYYTEITNVDVLAYFQYTTLPGCACIRVRIQQNQ